MNVLISGGSGFLGRALTQELLNDQSQHLEKDINITWLSRSKQHADTQHVSVMTYEELAVLPDSNVFDVIINLAGAGVIDARWSDARKKLLFDSRLEPTQALLDWMQRANQKPKVFVSGSAIGWYGVQGDKPLTESCEAIDEFQHQLCGQWEAKARQAEELGVRTIIVRTGVVLHPEGGMLARVLTPFKLALGGRIGNGQQILSWISLDDWVAAVMHLLTQSDVSGVYNLTAPNPEPNAIFAKKLAAQLHRPAVFPIPAIVLKLAMGEVSTLLLDGQRVLPERLQKAGFNFKHKHLENAFSDMLP